MNQRQHRTQFELVEGRRLNFYAALFNEVTEIKTRRGQFEYFEVIRPGAFTRTLSTDRDIVATVNHDLRKELARRSDGSLLLDEDPKGLFCSLWLPENEDGDGVMKAYAEGRITGASFTFDPVDNKMNDDGLVERLSFNFYEVCIAVGKPPAYPTTGEEVQLRTAPPNVDAVLARYRMLNFKIGRLHRFK